MGLLDLNIAPVATIKDLEDRIELWEKIAKDPKLTERFMKASYRLRKLGDKIKKKEEKDYEARIDKEIEKQLRSESKQKKR